MELKKMIESYKIIKQRTPYGENSIYIYKYIYKKEINKLNIIYMHRYQSFSEQIFSQIKPYFYCIYHCHV